MRRKHIFLNCLNLLIKGRNNVICLRELSSICKTASIIYIIEYIFFIYKSFYFIYIFHIYEIETDDTMLYSYSSLSTLKSMSLDWSNFA